MNDTETLVNLGSTIMCLSHVIADRVGQDDHAALSFLKLLSDLYCCCHG